MSMNTNSIQISIGYGSMGLMFRPVTPDELPALLAQTAHEMGYTVEAVEQKLRAGSTLWLNRQAERKIRGHDEQAAQRLAAQRDAERRQRMANDDYLRQA